MGAAVSAPFDFDEVSQSFFRPNFAADRAFEIRKYLVQLQETQRSDTAHTEALVLAAASLRFVYDRDGETAALNLLTDLRRSLDTRIDFCRPIKPGVEPS